VTSVAVRLISRFDEQRIQRALAPLLGKRLRTANRQSFTFGEDRSVPVRFPRPGQPPARLVAEYALTIQCPWRMLGAEGINIASVRPIIESVKGDNAGGLRIAMSGLIALELTPGESGEFWRLFRPGTNERHFVVCADGIYVD
jgi:hypothetical protein